MRSRQYQFRSKILSLQVKDLETSLFIPKSDVADISQWDLLKMEECPLIKLETDRRVRNGQRLKHQIKEDGQCLAREEWASNKFGAQG